MHLSCLEKRNLSDDVIALYSSLKREIGKGDTELFLGSRDRTYGSCSKLHQARFRLDIRKHVFTERIVKCWTSLQRGGQCHLRSV